MNETIKSQPNVLRLSRLKDKTGISGSSIYNKLNPRSRYYDPTFPKPIRLGLAAVGWLEYEIDDWLAERAITSRSA